MRKEFAVLSALVLLGIPARGQQTAKPAATQAHQTTQEAAAPEYKIPPAAVKRANPIKATSESVAEGKRMYGIDCAMCHGENGDGKGDLATDMKLQLKDFRDPASLKGRTDGELYYIIRNGKGQMPKEGKRQSPTEIWDMVNYLRSLAGKGGHENGG